MDQERIDAAVAEMIEIIGELAAEGEAQATEAERVAGEKIERYHEARDELAEAERKIEAFEAERETLPNRAYRAALDEDFEREDELKERYKNLKPALEALRKQAEELRAELAELVGPNPSLPGPTGHELDAFVNQHRPVLNAYLEALSSLHKVEQPLRVALANATAPAEATARRWGDQLRGWREEVRWDEEVREYKAARRQAPEAATPAGRSA